MNIIKNFPLSEHITLNMKGIAKQGVEVYSKKDLVEAINYAKKEKLYYSILGGGSNVYIPEYFDGLIILMKNRKIVIKENKVISSTGVIWDELVKHTISNNLGGMENLTRIPGTVGGAIVQNAGAYGVEIKNLVDTVEVYDPKTNIFKILSNKECKFNYRNSVFKKSNVIITEAVFNLPKDWRPNTTYDKVLGNTPQEIQRCIYNIREEKFGNHKNTAGSFFKNLLVNKKALEKLQKINKETPYFFDNKLFKIPLAFVMDKMCNLNGYTNKNLRLSYKNPIAIETTGKVTETELLDFIKEIKEIVYKKTNLDIEKEVVGIN